MRKQNGISQRINSYVRIKNATSGITLIALVVTIIVLLILAGVSIAMLTGENGILTRAQGAVEKYRESEEREIAELEDISNYIDNYGKKDEEPVVKYKLGDIVTQGDYDYIYMGCTDYDEFVVGLLKSSLYDEGIVCSSKEEVFENFSQVFMDCSWSELQEQGYTEETIIELLDITYEDYEYVKENNLMVSSWTVSAKDKTKTTYGTILEYIDGIPVTSMQGTFEKCNALVDASNIIIPSTIIDMTNAFFRCTSLEIAPTIPESVESLCQTFYGCTALENAPLIPNGVKDMMSTFAECTALEIPPIIPEGVENMSQTFYGCTNLKETPEIPEGVTSLYGTFRFCSSLTTVPNIPFSVTTMVFAFDGCTSLTGTLLVPCTCGNQYSLEYPNLEIKHYEGCGH